MLELKEINIINEEEKSDFTGNILLEKNGWFEGLVKSKKDDLIYFIFGGYFKDKTIKFFKINPQNYSTEMVEGEKHGKIYECSNYISKHRINLYTGKIKVTVKKENKKENSALKELIKGDIISLYKESLDSLPCYEEIINIKDYFLESIIYDYNQDVFTEDQLNILTGCNQRKRNNKPL